MNTSVAVWLSALIILAALVDGFANDWGVFLFLARKTIELIDWVEFWR